MDQRLSVSRQPTGSVRKLTLQGSATHVGYSDESSWNLGQYRSLALVTGQAEAMAGLETAVSALLRRSNVREMSWKGVKGADRRSSAIGAFDLIAATVSQQPMRVDVLIWDTHDSRHKIQGRDDSENLARMYYHLIANVINDRWNAVGSWLLMADERTDMDWMTLGDCLSGRRRRDKTALQRRLKDFAPPIRTASPPHVEQVSSSEQPLVQVADLFAGLAAFSWNQSRAHHGWIEVGIQTRSGQQNMFPDLAGGEVSNNARFKHEVLDHFAGTQLPGVAMKTEIGEGLRTFGPSNSINFWRYEPKRMSDKAPRKIIA